MQKFRKSIGYEQADPRADVVLRAAYDGDAPWPHVAWLRVGVLTATVKSSAPLDVFRSYNDWDTWAQFIQEVPPPCQRPPQAAEHAVLNLSMAS